MCCAAFVSSFFFYQRYPFVSRSDLRSDNVGIPLEIRTDGDSVSLSWVFRGIIEKGGILIRPRVIVVKYRKFFLIGLTQMEAIRIGSAAFGFVVLETR